MIGLHFSPQPGDDDEEPLYPDADVMHELGQSIRRVLGINLLGVDVIVERKTGRCGLIDVNPFPGGCQLVMSSRRPLPGVLFGDSIKDRAPVDFFYGCPIFKWVEET